MSSVKSVRLNDERTKFSRMVWLALAASWYTLRLEVIYYEKKFSRNNSFLIHMIFDAHAMFPN